MSAVIYINEDRKAVITGLSYETDAGATVYLNAATITYTLKTAAGVAVAGGTGTLDKVASIDGKYTGIIESTVTALLTHGGKYLLQVPIVEWTKNGWRELEVRALKRGST